MSYGKKFIDPRNIKLSEQATVPTKEVIEVEKAKKKVLVEDAETINK
jgi:cytochrome c peroxidase